MRRFFVWKLLPSIGRQFRTRSYFTLLFLVAFFALGVTLLRALPNDKSSWEKKTSDTVSNRRASSSHPPSFTVLLQTYNRTDLLLKLLHHYSAIPNVDRIVVVWNNVGATPPIDLWNSFQPHPVPVDFLPQSANKMRNRLQNFREIRTEAVLVMDDDVMTSAGDVSFAYTVWQEFPDQIVGFVPRRHVVAESGVYSYGSHELDSDYGLAGYSMVLIGAAFIHKKYLRLFERLPPAVHRLIDDTQNCDDIAFNVMVARELNRSPPTGISPRQRAAGLYVRPHDLRNLESEAESGYRGMWHATDHMLERSYCLNRLADMYGGRLTLPYSNFQVSRFGRCFACKS